MLFARVRSRTRSGLNSADRRSVIFFPRNVSPDVAARYKRASLAVITALSVLMLRCVPELGAQDAVKLAGVTMMMTGALWPHAQPSAPMLAAYQADPELAAIRLDFTATIREALEVMSLGLLARGAALTG